MADKTRSVPTARTGQPAGTPLSEFVQPADTPSQPAYFPVIVIGGGAAGLMAAISAARTFQEFAPAEPVRQNESVGPDDIVGPTVLLLERLDKVGRKLLATGNGRCNLTNRQAGPDSYHGREPRFARGALNRFPVAKTLSFFAGIGLPHRQEDEGRVYPYCQQAAAVLDLLRQEADRLRVREQTNCPVTRIERRDLDWSGSPATVSSAAFRVTAGETAWLADAIVLATGGQAAPALGSDGSGYTLAAQLGHSLIEPFPALVQICTAGRTTQAMTGIRFAGSVRLMADDQVLAFETGEILFTDYGVSGIPILQLSRRIGEWQQTARTVHPAGPAGELSLRLDLVPDFSTAELLQMLGHRQRLNPGLTAADFLTGLVHKRIGQQLVRECGIALDCRLSQVSQVQVQRLADILKALRLTVRGTRDWTQAQVTAGGLPCREFSPDRLASRRCQGLFAAGEVLDIDGDCGGFNLQWAWSSGSVAGHQAALYALEASDS